MRGLLALLSKANSRDMGQWFLLGRHHVMHKYTRKSHGNVDAEAIDRIRNKKSAGFTLGAPLTLSNLFRSPKSHKQKKRYRGIASGGRTHGRGAGGQKSRSGAGIPRGFEGGQTPLHKILPKFGFKNVFARNYSIFPLEKLQLWIDTGRIDASRPITMKTLADAGLHSIKDGVKILGTGVSYFKHKVHIEASQFSESAMRRIEELGGTAVAVHYNKLGLRVLLKPHAVLYRKTECQVRFREYIASLLEKQNAKLVELKDLRHSLASDEENTTSQPRTFSQPALAHPFSTKAEQAGKKKSLAPLPLDKKGRPINYIGGLYDPTSSNKGSLEKAQIKELLDSVERGSLAPTTNYFRLVSLLPRFAGPVAANDIGYYTNDDKRGYMSSLMLERVGRLLYEALNNKDSFSPLLAFVKSENVLQAYSTLPKDISPKQQSHFYRRLGIEFWMIRNHVVVSKNIEEVKKVLEEHHFSVPGSNNAVAMKELEKEHEAKNTQITALLETLGVQHVRVEGNRKKNRRGMIIGKTKITYERSKPTAKQQPSAEMKGTTE